MTDTASKARRLRMERLRTMLDQRLDNPAAALETLMSELHEGEPHPDLWEGLHAAACRDAKEKELAAAYQKVVVPRRLQQLSPGEHAEVLMHAADYFLGVLGDPAGAEPFLWHALAVVPGHVEAFTRLERRFEAARDRVRLAKLYAAVASAPPLKPEELAARAMNTVGPLASDAPLPDDDVLKLAVLMPASHAIMGVLEAHCRKTRRFGLAARLMEDEVKSGLLPLAEAVERRRRLIELYMGDAHDPARTVEHLEFLLARDPADARAREVANKLVSHREVGDRLGEALQEARRRLRGQG